MNKTIGQRFDELSGFLKEYRTEEKDKMANSDTLGLIEKIKVAKAELGKTAERMMGAQRKVIGLRTRRDVTQSDVEGQIKNLELFAKQRLQIDKEIDVAAQNLAEERARRLQIADIEDRYTADVQELYETVTLERTILMEVTTQPIMEDEAISVCQSTSKKQNSDPELKTLLRAGRRLKEKIKKMDHVFPPFERVLETRLPVEFLIRRMTELRHERASRLFSISRYAEVNRRVLVRTTAVYGEGVEFIESWSLPDRFWLCIARHQHLETKEKGVGVKGAKRGYRVSEIARDLNVPPTLATKYRDAAVSNYHGFMPAEFDCLIAETEDGIELPECWDYIRRQYEKDVPASIRF